jgi:alanine racemase
MDMIMADVTDIPDVDMEDEVILMGGQGDERITPDELAELAETIPYEIMLGFGARIPVEMAD